MSDSPASKDINPAGGAHRLAAADLADGARVRTEAAAVPGVGAEHLPPGVHEPVRVHQHAEGGRSHAV